MDAMIVSLVLGVLSVSAPGGQELREPSMNLRLMIPDGFEQSTAAVDTRPLAYVFLREGPTPAQRVCITIRQLQGPITRGSIADELRARHPQARIVPVKWKGFELEAFSLASPAAAEAEPAEWAVHLPLSPRGVELRVLAGPGGDEQARELLAELLASADGPVAWLSAAEKDKAVRDYSTRLTLTGGAVVGMLLTMMYLRRKRRQSQ
jgi:hypothetical protein